jgi:mannose-6-phosphate isomerase-like protein (cupin superfamily)
MEGFIRRVVTGHDKDGRAIVISDGLAPVVSANPLRGGHRSTDIWKTKAMPAPITRTEEDPTPGPRDFTPRDGVKIRISELPPEPEAFSKLTPDQAREFFASGGHASSSTFGRGGRHPFMHRTETIDYAVVLEGEVTMLLDDQDIVLKAGDVVIQRGTNHAWSNRSGKPVRMLYILIDGKYEPDLAELFKDAAGH